MKVQCQYNASVQHEFPDDWVFGGANGKHPGADPRWRPTSYIYYDQNLLVTWHTSSPLCDEEAIARIADLEDTFGRGVEPCEIHWLHAVHPGETRETTLIWSRMDEQAEAMASGDYEEPTPEEREELDSLGSSNT